MQNGGSALMGTGVGQGENRALEAAQQAISSPLLDNISIAGATGVLINIVGGDLTMDEVTQIAEIVHEAVGDDAEIIFGAAIDQACDGEMRMTVIATGFDRAVTGEVGTSPDSRPPGCCLSRAPETGRLAGTPAVRHGAGGAGRAAGADRRLSRAAQGTTARHGDPDFHPPPDGLMRRGTGGFWARSARPRGAVFARQRPWPWHRIEDTAGPGRAPPVWSRSADTLRSGEPLGALFGRHGIGALDLASVVELLGTRSAAGSRRSGVQVRSPRSRFRRRGARSPSGPERHEQVRVAGGRRQQLGAESPGDPLGDPTASGSRDGSRRRSTTRWPTPVFGGRRPPSGDSVNLAWDLADVFAWRSISPVTSSPTIASS